MPFLVPIEEAARQFPEYEFVAALTPSAQKAAFHVRDRNTGTSYCLKLISPNYELDRLNREIHAMQSINHPNVVKLVEYTYSSTEGRQRHYIVEEFIDGTDLTCLLQPGRPMPRSQTKHLFIELSNGLSALNAENLVHRDFKPSNIRVRPSGSPVIIDFGLARHLDLPDLTLTAQGAAIGTLPYFAPEQFIGTKYDIQHRTDLFSLGLILFEALLGRHPFFHNGMSRQELSDAICYNLDYLAQPDYVALPNQWRMILTRLIEKNAGKRPHNAGQLVSLFQKIQED